MIRLHPASRSHGAGRRQRPYVLGDRCGPLVQSGEGQLHLGLNAGCAQYPATRPRGRRHTPTVLPFPHRALRAAQSPRSGPSEQPARGRPARASARRPISPAARTAEPRPISTERCSATRRAGVQAGQWRARSGGCVPTLVPLATNRFHGVHRADSARQNNNDGADAVWRLLRRPHTSGTQPSSSRRTMVRGQIRLGTGTPEPSPAQLSLTGGSR
jgi:hypothetical protein